VYVVELPRQLGELPNGTSGRYLVCCQSGLLLPHALTTFARTRSEPAGLPPRLGVPYHHWRPFVPKLRLGWYDFASA